MTGAAGGEGRCWVIDGMNVIGSRPDGWWRDRVGAQQRFVDEVGGRPRPDSDEVVVVFDGRPWAPLPSRPRVLFAEGGPDAADRVIVDLVSSAPDPSAVAVVTADRALVRAVRSRGAEVMAPGAWQKLADGCG